MSNGKCTEAAAVGPSISAERRATFSSEKKQKKQQYYMGYSVRSHQWRYTVWMPAAPNANDTSRPALITDWSATATSTPPRFTELYHLLVIINDDDQNTGLPEIYLHFAMPTLILMTRSTGTIIAATMGPTTIGWAIISTWPLTVPTRP